MTESVERTIEERPVRIAAGPVTLECNLSLPNRAYAVVLFAHGSGSSRHSSRNRCPACLAARGDRERALA
jgi:putative phosphoribosyl transferase